MTMMIAKVKGVARQQLGNILKDIYFSLGLGTEFCVAIARIK
jgi:hypothetical protein